MVRSLRQRCGSSSRKTRAALSQTSIEEPVESERPEVPSSRTRFARSAAAQVRKISSGRSCAHLSLPSRLFLSSRFFLSSRAKRGICFCPWSHMFCSEPAARQTCAPILPSPGQIPRRFAPRNDRGRCAPRNDGGRRGPRHDRNHRASPTDGACPETPAGPSPCLRSAIARRVFPSLAETDSGPPGSQFAGSNVERVPSVVHRIPPPRSPGRRASSPLPPARGGRRAIAQSLPTASADRADAAAAHMLGHSGSAGACRQLWTVASPDCARASAPGLRSLQARARGVSRKERAAHARAQLECRAGCNEGGVHTSRKSSPSESSRLRRRSASGLRASRPEGRAGLRPRIGGGDHLDVSATEPSGRCPCRATLPNPRKAPRGHGHTAAIASSRISSPSSAVCSSMFNGGLIRITGCTTWRPGPGADIPGRVRRVAVLETSSWSCGPRPAPTRAGAPLRARRR